MRHITAYLDGGADHVDEDENNAGQPEADLFSQRGVYK
jgi:hypothetical protein